MKDREALNEIHRLMFGIDWHEERLRKIGEALTAAGYQFETEPEPIDTAGASEPRQPDTEAYDVMVVLDRVWTDEEAEVVESKTVEHEVIGTFTTEDAARRHIAALQPGPCSMSNRHALDLIYGAIDCQEWTGDTIAAISVILTAHGYTVRGPLLASDYGEAPDPDRIPASFHSCPDCPAGWRRHSDAGNCPPPLEE